MKHKQNLTKKVDKIEEDYNIADIKARKHTRLEKITMNESKQSTNKI